MKILTWLEEHNKLSWTLTIIAILTIFIMSQIVFGNINTGSPGTKSFISLAILYHFMAFFCLAFFLTISITKGKLNFKQFTICFLLCVIYALTDEIHQFFVLGRWMDVQDIRVDVLGIGFAQIIYSFHLIKFKKKAKNVNTLLPLKSE